MQRFTKKQRRRYVELVDARCRRQLIPRTQRAISTTKLALHGRLSARRAGKTRAKGSRPEMEEITIGQIQIWGETRARVSPSPIDSQPRARCTKRIVKSTF